MSSSEDINKGTNNESVAGDSAAQSKGVIDTSKVAEKRTEAREAIVTQESKEDAQGVTEEVLDELNNGTKSADEVVRDKKEELESDSKEPNFIEKIIKWFMELIGPMLSAFGINLGDKGEKIEEIGKKKSEEMEKKKKEEDVKIKAELQSDKTPRHVTWEDVKENAGSVSVAKSFDIKLEKPVAATETKDKKQEIIVENGKNLYCERLHNLSGNIIVEVLDEHNKFVKKDMESLKSKETGMYIIPSGSRISGIGELGIYQGRLLDDNQLKQEEDKKRIEQVEQAKKTLSDLADKSGSEIITLLERTGSKEIALAKDGLQKAKSQITSLSSRADFDNLIKTIKGFTEKILDKINSQSTKINMGVAFGSDEAKAAKQLEGVAKALTADIEYYSKEYSCIFV